MGPWSGAVWSGFYPMSRQTWFSVDPARRELVELRFFAGLDYAELVPLLGRSERTLKREWAAARAALQAMMA